MDHGLLYIVVGPHAWPPRSKDRVMAHVALSGVCSWEAMLCNTRALSCITTSNGLSSVSVCDEMLCPLLTPHFSGEISPFLGVFSGWYPSKKKPDNLFSGMRGYRGYGYLWREGYTWCIDATFLPGLDDYPWPCAVHRSVRETVERVRRRRVMPGGRSREWQEQPLPPRQVSRHGSARRDDRNPDQNWRAVVSGVHDRRGQ
jgi:hypothetical protein